MQTMQFLLAGVSYLVHVVFPCHEEKESPHQYRTLWLICPEEMDFSEQAEESMKLEDIARKFDVCVICVKEEDLEGDNSQLRDILKPLWFYIHRNLPVSVDPKENYIVGIEMGGVMVLKLGMKYGCYYHAAGVFSAKLDPAMDIRSWMENIKAQEDKIETVYLAWGPQEKTQQYQLELEEELRRAGVKVVKHEVDYKNKWQFWGSQLIGMLSVLEKKS